MDGSSRVPLSERLVRLIFAELQGAYGTRFLNKYRTGQMTEDGRHDRGIINTMRVWADGLGGFKEAAIADALKNLPPGEEAPSLPAFVDLCRNAARRQGSDLSALPYRPTPEEEARAKANAAKLKRDAEDLGQKDPLGWAKNPSSQSALNWIIALAGETGDPRFKPILQDLKDRGITDGNRLLTRAQ